MPTRNPQPEYVSWDQVAAFRLARHHLSERAPRRSLAAVVRDMAGAQAQLLSAAQISLWARVHDLGREHVQAALDRRTLVKAGCMRRTLFLVPAKDLAMFVRGSARRAEREMRWARGKGVAQKTLEAAIDAALAALDRPSTRAEIAERAGRALGVRARAVHGGGWGSRRRVAAVPVGHLTYPVVDLLHLAATRGVVCYGPYRGAESTFVRADAWLPRWRDLSPEEAEGRLLRTYLRAFGPANAEDFAVWTGITFAEARQIWAREQSGIAAVDVQGWEAAVLREDLEALAGADLERPHVRLLPFFDSFLLGHRERAHLAAGKDRPAIYRPQGWVAPVVLVNGRASAVWEHTREASRLRVNVTRFGSLSRIVSASLRKEASGLGRFLGLPITEVRIG